MLAGSNSFTLIGKSWKTHQIYFSKFQFSGHEFDRFLENSSTPYIDESGPWPKKLAIRVKGRMLNSVKENSDLNQYLWCLGEGFDKNYLVRTNLLVQNVFINVKTSLGMIPSSSCDIMTHHVTYQFDDHVIDHVTDHDTLQNMKIKQRFEIFGFLENLEKFEFRNPF